MRREVPALQGVPVGRLVPALTRFATATTPWDAPTLIAAAYNAARRRGWTTQTQRIRQPAAWWAHLLSDVDDTDRYDQLPDPTAPDPVPTTAAHSPSKGPATGMVATAPPAAGPAHGATGGRRLSLWDTHERNQRIIDAETERRAVHELAAAERAERAGHGLCAHGAGGADPRTKASPRCATCRYGH